MRNFQQAFLLILVVLGIHTDVAFGARWSEINTGLPRGTAAAVMALAVDPQTGSTLYAQTWDSTFKSTDGGENWKALSITRVRVLAIDPTTPSTIYAGTADGILKSTNGGESWGSAGLSDMAVGSLVVNPITPSTIYAAAGTYAEGDIQMYKSTDGGEVWTALNLGFSAYVSTIFSITLDPLTPSTLYVLGGYVIHKSTDAGESWNAIPGVFMSALAIDPLSPSTLYAIRAGEGFSKSTDSGASWTAIRLAGISGTLTVDPRNSNIVYAATYWGSGATPVTYKSMDGGWNWKALNPSFPTGHLVIDAGNPSTFYAMTFRGGLSRSIDSGAHWTEINNGRRAHDIRVLVGSPGDPATIYAGGDGLFKSIDSGGYWQKQELPPSPTSAFLNNESAGVRSMLIHPTDANTLYVVANLRASGCYYDENVLFKSTDSGVTWSNSVSPKRSGCTYAGLMGMDPTDSNVLYFRKDLESYDDLLKTTDGGEHWSYTGLYGARVGVLNVLAIDPASPATLYAGTLSGVFKSTDGGDHWDLIGLPKTNVQLLAIDPRQPNILYASAAGPWGYPGFRGLFKSTDSGANWSPMNHGLAKVLDTRAPVNALILDPNHPDTLYLGTSGYGVFKSLDAGVTWSPLNEGLMNLDVRVLTLIRSASPTVYAGTPGGVFKIVEDGSSGERSQRTGRVRSK